MSSYAGYNLTASSGGNIPPSIDETEASAAKANVQIALNMKPGIDSIDTNFTQFHRDETWKYKSDSSRPSLAPIQQLRVGNASDPAPDSSWKGEFDNLVDLLPPNLKAFLLKEQALPKEARSPAFLKLEGVLVLAAKFLTGTARASAPDISGSVKSAQNSLFAALPSIFTTNLIDTGGEALDQCADAILNLLGANDPDFDAVNSNWSGAQEGLNHLTNEENS